ncbi:structural maintenance of chromosomes protein 3-like [Anopheles maculipalpis]|uniref:structural maintenance of chromosomes protein 3-like n=1 Tax=Anopheles maculipalpis TaxID=1496333 RepID=UPI0021592EA6|nr:structural maintenance of chromosomes protein 3-like [Anopheles maculipalpis]
MYLKEIIINGFKSYMDQTVIEQLHPKHNVVVGRNGSGKSNFFSAIEFVLSDEYNNLRQSERSGLINKGASKSRTGVAFVEIVLGEKASITAKNKSSGCSETRIRRTISATKDQYTLNGHNATRKEVVEMLDSLGLAFSNPYYIVKQGKINQLATACPPQLLQVLYEIGGIRVYDAKLKETIKLMDDADKCLKQIRFVRNSLAERLKLLCKDKKLQEQFEQLDKKHRLLSFKVLEKKHQVAVDALKSLDQTEQLWKEEQHQRLLQKSEAMEKWIAMKNIRRENKIQLENVLYKQNNLNEEHIVLQEQKVKLELQLQDIKEELAMQIVDQERERTELNHQREEISNVQKTLEKVKDRLAVVQERKDTLEAEISKKKEMRNEIFDKQRRGIQFETREERNEFLKEEIGYVCNQIQLQTEALNSMKSEHSDLINSLEVEKNNWIEHQTDLAALATRKKGYKLELAQIGTRLEETKTLLETCLAGEENTSQEIKHWHEQSEYHELKFSKQMGSRIMCGWRSIAKVLDMLRSQSGDSSHPTLEGYYGRVFEAFQCDEAIFRAVEMVAGTKLYFHIVESEAVANEIIALCNKHNLKGDLNFMPLSRLKGAPPVHVDVAKDKTVQPLVSLIKFPNRFELVFQHIFGNTLLCDALEPAVNANRKYGHTCVTRDGDMVGRGTLTGGYRASDTSHLHKALYFTEVGKTMEKLKSTLEELLKCKEKAYKITSADELRRDILEAKLDRMVQTMENIQAALNRSPAQCQKLEEKRRVLERKIRNQQTKLAMLMAKEESVNRELETEFVCVLSEEEKCLILQLDEELRCLEKQHNEAFNAELEVQQEKVKLENILNAKLIPKRDELIVSLTGRNCSSLTDKKTTYEQQQKKVSEKIELLVDKISNVEHLVRKLTDKNGELSKEVDNWSQKLKLAEEAIATKDPREMSHKARKQQLAQEVEQYAKEIEDFGVLPAPEEAYEKMPLSTMIQELERTNKQLKNCGCVNKAAIDEYARVAQSLNAMDEKLKVSEDSRKLHASTVLQLRTQRVNCIEHIFNTVNRNFVDIFSRFVPAGCGKLILQTTDNNGNDETNSDETDDDVGAPDRYVGLTVEVSFTASEGVRSELHTLSGGQKTLVAIALIFAMQRYNPAPFYLFDEIDQALDSEHRKVVANEIHALSENSQFITITFRRELLDHADKFYGVRYHNTLSSIGPVSKEQAFDFVVDDTIRR